MEKGKRINTTVEFCSPVVKEVERGRSVIITHEVTKEIL